MISEDANQIKRKQWSTISTQVGCGWEGEGTQSISTKGHLEMGVPGKEGLQRSIKRC